MRRSRALATLLIVSLPLAGGAFWTGGTAQTARGTPIRAPGTDVSVAAVAPEPVVMELRGVRRASVGRKLDGARAREAAEEVRAVIDRLYRLGFVDAAASPPAPRLEVAQLFGEDIRDEVVEDLARLTLGPAAFLFQGLRVIEGSVGVRVLSARRRPLLAVARTEFRGIGLTGAGGALVRHRGNYVLRRGKEGWRIVSYDVEGRVPGPGAPPRDPAIVRVREDEVVRGRATPTVPSGKRLLFYLVIGSDARPGEPVARLRADSIHIVGVNPKRRGGAIVGIPRDSFVHIPGAGTRKINEALHIGGPRLMVRTVRRLTGIPIQGYLLTGFKGFASFVGRIGGLRVKVPYRMNDAASGARFRRGLRRLTGNQALAFARNRHDAPGGDFGRSLNQGRLILSALRKYRGAVLQSPGAFLPWLVAGMATVRTDLGFEKILGLMLSAPRIDPGRVKNQVVSGSGAMVGGASVVRLGAPAQRIFRDLRRDAMLRG